MTTYSNDRRKEYAGNNEARVFTGPRAFLASHIVVYEVDDATQEATLQSGYTLENVGVRNRQTIVTMPAPVAVGKTLLILRLVPYEQGTNITNQGAYLPQVVEDALDALSQQIQQLEEGVARSFRAPDTAPGLEPIANTPNRYVVTDAFGNPAVADSPPTADLTMRSDLASIASGKGGELVSFNDAMAPAYLKTVSQMIAGMPVSLMRFIDPTEHSDIRAGTSTYDCSDDLNAAFQEYKNFGMPAGRFALGGTLLVPDRLSIVGDGYSMPFSGGFVREPLGSVFRMLPGSNCDAFRQEAKASRYSLNFARFAVDGDGANQGNVGNTPDGTYGMYQFNRNAFFFEALYNAIFESVLIYNMRGAGWALHGDVTAGMTNVFLKACHAYNCRTYSVYCEGSTTDLRIFGGDFGLGRAANLRLTSSCTVNDAVFWTSQCQDLTDAATHATGTGAIVNGGILIAGNNNKLSGIRSEGNAGHGIRVVGDDNDISDAVLLINANAAAATGLFDGINDLGERNRYKDVDIRQSSGSSYALRKAIKLESGHADTRIIGGNMTRIGANAAVVALPVQGFAWSAGDRSDFSWGTGEVKAYSAAANSIGTSATKVQFRTETIDARGEWSIVNDNFTAAEAGVYRIDTGVNIANATDGNSFTLAIYKNAAEYRRLGQQRAGAGASIQICGGLEMKLEAGDVIDIRGTCGTASNTNVGAVLTWIEITQITG